MTRRTAAAASAALAALATVCACTGSSTDDTTSTDETTTTQSSDPPTTPSADEPIDLMQIPEGTALEPATYSTELFYGDGATRVIVDLPEGYVGDGPIIAFDGGDMAFWDNVSLVDPDPCLGGKPVDAGTSVHDLAALLVARRHVKTSQPVPVTIGGYHGVYVKTTAPADLDRCRNGNLTILAAGKGHWLSSDVPNGIVDHWILDVNGQRVVGGTRMLPHTAKRDEAIGIIESAEFTVAD